MKYLKLYEGFSSKIDDICKKYWIGNYTINDDGSIDVDGSVTISKRGLRGDERFGLRKVPLKFRNVNGYFDFSGGILKSLDGCPKLVDLYFDCSNNKLTSLEGGPELVGHDYYCNGNEIRTFEGFPRNLGGNFYCNNNPIYYLWILFKDPEKVELFNDFGITDGEVVILERLNEFLEMIGKPITNTKLLEEEGYKII